MVYFITRDVAVVTDLWCLAQVWIRRASDERRRALTSTAFVSEEKETSARGRLVGIARAVHRRSRLRVSFSCLVCFPLVVVLWCVGNPDLWDRGLVCFWGTFLLWLVYPNLPIAWAQARARITYSITGPNSNHERRAQSHELLPVRPFRRFRRFGLFGCGDRETNWPVQTKSTHPPSTAFWVAVPSICLRFVFSPWWF